MTRVWPAACSGPGAFGLERWQPARASWPAAQSRADSLGSLSSSCQCLQSTLFFDAAVCAGLCGQQRATCYRSSTQDWFKSHACLCCAGLCGHQQSAGRCPPSPGAVSAATVMACKPLSQTNAAGCAGPCGQRSSAGWRSEHPGAGPAAAPDRAGTTARAVSRSGPCRQPDAGCRAPEGGPPGRDAAEQPGWGREAGGGG